jgi:hypothetical protein
MSFTVRFRRTAGHQISSWRLPDGVLVDVYERLRDDLSHEPASRLERTTHPFDGMTYTFPAVDTSNRRYGYVFTFLIKYGVDEETLWVVRGIYIRTPL